MNDTCAWTPNKVFIHFLLVSVETARVLLQSWWARLSTGASRQTHHDDHDDNGDEHAHADDDCDHDDDDDDDHDDDDDDDDRQLSFSSTTDEGTEVTVPCNRGACTVGTAAALTVKASTRLRLNGCIPIQSIDLFVRQNRPE